MVLHGIALLASARGLYLARHLSTLYIIIFCPDKVGQVLEFPKLTNLQILSKDFFNNLHKMDDPKFYQNLSNTKFAL